MDISTGGSGHPSGAGAQTHTDPHGHQWRVIVHWATVDGAAVPVGLDLHAFVDGQDDTGIGPTGGVLNAAVVRSLRVAELIEQSRRLRTSVTSAAPGRDTPAPAARGPRRAEDVPIAATCTALRRPGRPAERGDDFIAEVAALYHQARALGGEPARKPWRYVVEQLAVRGVPNVTEGQLKNWSRRARRLGLLSPRSVRARKKRAGERNGKEME